MSELNKLKDSNYNPDLIIDVGCSNGGWYDWYSDELPPLDYWGFDPNPEYKLAQEKFLEKYRKRWVHNQNPPEQIFFPVALGAEHETKFMNMSGVHSSFLGDVNGKTWGKRKKVSVETLDSYPWQQYNNILLKLDAQGYEHKILEGAVELLESGKVQFIIMEVSLIEFQKGIPLITDTLVSMKNLGYSMYGILREHYRPLDDRVGQLDVLFVDNRSEFSKDQRWTAKEGGMP